MVYRNDKKAQDNRQMNRVSLCARASENSVHYSSSYFCLRTRYGHMRPYQSCLRRYVSDTLLCCLFEVGTGFELKVSQGS